jgi:hypothetical protein
MPAINMRDYLISLGVAWLVSKCLVALHYSGTLLRKLSKPFASCKGAGSSAAKK